MNAATTRLDIFPREYGVSRVGIQRIVLRVHQTVEGHRLFRAVTMQPRMRGRV